MESILRALAQDLLDRGKIDVSECFIDGTFVGAKKGGLGVVSKPRQFEKTTMNKNKCTEILQHHRNRTSFLKKARREFPVICVVNVRNGEKFFAAALESVFSQTLRSDSCCRQLQY